MATTTNYSWTTPDDTALVKDGAAAIRSLGTAIDSTVFTNAGNAIAKTIVDAKGDIIAATAADTVSRLAVGPNGTVLTAASGQATGLEWATPASGGMTLISTTALSGASVTLSSIPQTYNNLYIVVRDLISANDNQNFRIRLNGDSGANRYLARDPSNANATSTFLETAFTQVGASIDNAVAGGIITVTFFDYTNTTTRKMGWAQFNNPDSATNTSTYIGQLNLIYNQTAAISSITFFMGSGNITSGTALLYGVK
jgi:hypothetical protein